MADSSVIREFLVALGFRADEATLRRFEDGVDRATRTVVGLATAIETTALAVSVGVARFASNLEALYFASLKTGASASNLKAFDQAAQNFGTTAGEALQSVQGLARMMRTNPGSEGLLESLGVQTRDVNMQLRDTTDIMLGLAERFSTMPYYLASQYAAMFGISEDTLRAMRQGDFAKEVVRMREEMRRTGFDKAAEDAHRFMVEVRDLKVQLQAIGVQIYDALVRKLGGGVHSLTEWLRANGPMIAERTGDILVTIIELAEIITPAIAWLVDKFIALDDATDGWSTKIIALLVLLKMIGAGSIVGGILGLAGAFGRLGIALAAVSAAGVGGWKLGNWIYDQLTTDVQDKIGETIARVLAAFGNDEANEALASNNPVQFFVDRGWTRDQAAGIVANLQAESGMNPQAVGDNGQAYGLAQWHPDRQRAFEKWLGKPIQQSNRYEQMEFVDYELKRGAERRAGDLLRAATNARQAGEIVSRYYERPAAADTEAAKRGAAAVNISQETNIHVHGSGDATAVARSTAREQTRVNSDLVRNMQVAVQ